jgi:hypothetical protein
MRNILRSGGGEVPDRMLDRVAPLCGRADCSRPASARLMLDMANRVVSIDMEIDEVGAGMLCYQHAEKVVVPRGWTLEDRRVIDPYLFDGAPYDVEADFDDEPDEAGQKSNRKERRRRKLLPQGGSPSSSSSSSSSSSPPTTETADADGQLSLGGEPGGNYDLPDEYEATSLADPLPPIDDPKSETKSLPVVEADRNTSPLLSRAFDMSRTRGHVRITPTEK